MSAPTLHSGDSSRSESPVTNSFAKPWLGAGATHGARLADLEERRSVERAMTMGAFVWPAFTLIDLYLGLVVYPGAPVWLFVAFRVLGQCGILLVLRASRRKEVTSRALLLSNAAVCAACSLMISVMAVHFGGLASPYVHGLSIVILVEAIAVPAPFKNTLLYSTPSVLSFPLVLLLGPEHDVTRAQVADSSQLLTFAAHYVMVLSTVAVAAVSGQIAWNARIDLQRARRIGRYRLEAPLGRGGMNEVWLAWDESLKRKVALKILRSQATLDSHAAQRFEREALALSQLGSSNTVRIFDFGASDDGFSYIAMEYLRGADLDQLVRRSGPLPPARVVHFGIQACRSLAEAHAAGIVHRDVKPANLFASDDTGEADHLKVLDFGIARSSSSGATTTNVVAGTPAYMAPEAFWSGAADARSDVYSLGATMYFLLTGTAPFEGRGAMAGSAHLLEVPEAPSMRLGCPLPDALEAVVLRCLEKGAEHRFASAAALSEALSSCAETLSAWSAEQACAAWAELSPGSESAARRAS